MFKLRYVLILMLISALSGICCARLERPVESNSGSRLKEVPGSLFKTGGDLRKLIVDLTEANACEYLEGRFRTLSKKGTALVTGVDPSIGVLWIKECAVKQEQADLLKLDLSGSGWRQIDRKRSFLGAEFFVKDVARFNFKIFMKVKPDMAYTPQSHIVNVWLIPTEPVEVQIQVVGKTDVDTETLWSSIVGTAATILGKSPEKRAQRMIEKKAEQRFNSKLDYGVTLILDLCTGQYDLRFGKFEKGKMPKAPLPANGKRYQVSKQAVLDPNNLFLSGPFKTDEEVSVLLDVEKGSLKASWVCQKSAEEIAKAFMENKPLPDLTPVSQVTLSAGQSRELIVPKQTNCQVVLLLETEELETKNAYLIYNKGDNQKPIVDCSE